MVRKANWITGDRLLVGLVAAAFLVAGCKGKKDETDEPLKIPEKKSAEASATATTATAAPDASQSAAPTPTASAATTASGGAASPGATPGPAANIDKCCAALTAVQSSGLGSEAKKKSATAAATCPGIAALVRSGKTSRAAALLQLRSALAGASVPQACD